MSDVLLSASFFLISYRIAFINCTTAAASSNHFTAVCLHCSIRSAKKASREKTKFHPMLPISIITSQRSMFANTIFLWPNLTVKHKQKMVINQSHTVTLAHEKENIEMRNGSSMLQFV